MSTAASYPYPGYADEAKGPHILGVFWAFYSLSLIAVSARLWIRSCWLKNIGSDDYIIAAAMVLLASYTIVTTINIKQGFGTHTLVIENQGGSDLLTQILLLNYADFALGIMSFTTPKLAVASLLNRLTNPGMYVRAWNWFLAGSVFVTSSVCIVVLFCMCDPPEALWKPQMMATGATCKPQSVLVDYALFTGALSAFVDLYFAVYPAVVLWKLQITLQKKLALMAALGLGSVACAMAIVKCRYLPTLYNTADSTYGTADLVMWTSIESNIIIIGSCIPTLGPLFEMVRGKRSWSSQDRYYKSSTHQLHSMEHDQSSKKPRSKVRDPDEELLRTRMGAQEGSEESILKKDKQNKGGLGINGIQRTDQVVVEYESRDPSAERQPSW